MLRATVRNSWKQRVQGSVFVRLRHYSYVISLGCPENDGRIQPWQCDNWLWRGGSLSDSLFFRPRTFLSSVVSIHYRQQGTHIYKLLHTSCAWPEEIFCRVTSQCGIVLSPKAQCGSEHLWLLFVLWRKNHHIFSIHRLVRARRGNYQSTAPKNG